MNNIEFEKTKKELEEIKKQNDEQIAISDERTRMSKVNSLEYKGGTTLFFSMLVYVVLLLTSLCLTKSLGTSVITNIFPWFTYPIALIGGSIGIGAIGKSLFDKKYELKERLKAFSNAKTQAEKLEEEVHYQIELEKANNRNIAIDETIKVLDSNQSMLSRISSRYDLSDKTAPQSKEEAEKKAEELSAIIKEQYDKLDILTTQKVLHDRFWKVRQKFQRRTNTSLAPMISGTFAMFFGAFPTIMIRDAMPSGSLLTTSAVPLAPLAIGVIGGSAYMLKRNSDYKKAFNNLNAQLGENALEENLDKRFEDAFEEQKEIESLLERQIRDISLTEVQLQETKRYLDTHVTEKEKKKDSEEHKRTNSILDNLGKKSVENIINDPTPFPDGVYRPMYNVFTTQEEEKQEKGPTLVKRRKPTNPNDKK